MNEEHHRLKKFADGLTEKFVSSQELEELRQEIPEFNKVSNKNSPKKEYFWMKWFYQLR